MGIGSHMGKTAQVTRGLIASLMTAVLMTGCVPASDGSGTPALVSSTTPKRVVMQIVNNACGQEDAADSESLTTGQVKGLTKVLNGFGVPYDEHADAFSVIPKPVTDSSYEANKERGVGYMGIESHMPQELAAGQTHSPDHPNVGNEPGDTFPNLTTEEEKYGISMRWEYYKQDNSGHGLDGYSAFMRLGASEGKQYVAVHNTVTDKWVICCPYDWGPDLRLPTTSGTKYSGGRIGGVAPQAAEDLGISGGDGPADSMCECWWVENSAQVKCGPVNDLSSLAGASSGSSSAKASVATVVATSVASQASALVSQSAEVSMSLAPASPNSFIGVERAEWAHGDLPAGKTRYVVLHDTNVYAMTASEVISEIDRLGIGKVPHFLVDRDGTITQCVPLSSIARHAGTSYVPGANASFSISQERDDEVGIGDGDLALDHAMDAWSVGIALVHDQDDGAYPNIQLNALDRLVAYIDQQLPQTPRIITQEDWAGTSGTFSVDSEGQADEADADSVPGAPEGFQPGITNDDGTFEPALFSFMEEPTDEQRSDGAMSSVATSLPASSYDETRNHVGATSEDDPLAVSQAGGCSDSEDAADDDDDDEGPGDKIARKAVEIASKPQDCDPVAAAVSKSGADDSYPTDGGASRQLNYLSGSPKWQRQGTLRTGDLLSYACRPGDVLVASGTDHAIIYVGESIVATRWAGLDANVFEEGPDAGIGLCVKMDTLQSPLSYDVFRCIKSDEGDIIAESLKVAKRRIKNLPSLTEWLIATDYDRNVTHVFKGEKGKWEVQRSFRVITGKNRYFGNENYRKGVNVTPIGVFSIWSAKKGERGLPAFCVADTHGHVYKDGKYLCTLGDPVNGGATCFIHGSIHPSLPPGVDRNTYGEDFVATNLARGKMHAGSGGCTMLMREDAIWCWDNVFQVGDSTCYVWTETPATENDGFENEQLKEIMLSKGYCDVAQLSQSERAFTTLNTKNFKEDWTWADVDAAYNGKGGTDVDGSNIHVDVTKP